MSAPADFAILGATASGKTSLALELADLDPSIELCSVDAFACYRRLDIGTAKPDTLEQSRARWHLLDLVEPTEQLSMAEFVRVGRGTLRAIAGRGNRAGLVGGSGLYLRALVDGLEPPPRYPAVAAELEELADAPDGLPELYGRLVALDPLAATRMEPTNRRRVLRALEVTLGSGSAFSSFGPGLEVYAPTPTAMIGLTFEKAELERRIGLRLSAQLATGFLDEVAALAADGVVLSRTAAQAIGYRELAGVIDGTSSLDEATEEILRRSRALARRQLAWLRRDPRIEWVEATRSDLVEHVAGLIDRRREAGDVAVRPQKAGGTVRGPHNPV